MSSNTEVEKVANEGTTSTWIVCGTKFEVDSRYEIMDPMGQGAYGVVVAAKDIHAED